MTTATLADNNKSKFDMPKPNAPDENTASIQTAPPPSKQAPLKLSGDVRLYFQETYCSYPVGSVAVIPAETAEILINKNIARRY